MKENLDYIAYFSTPIYVTHIPEWVDNLNKASDSFILEAKKRNKTFYEKFNKKIKKKFGDFGLSHHSNSLIGVSKFKEFNEYAGAFSSGGSKKS